MAGKRATVAFVKMLLLRTEKLPEGPDWLYELKFVRCARPCARLSL